MNKLLLLKDNNFFKFEENVFKIKIKGNKMIKFSRKFKFFPKNKDFITLIWDDKIKHLTNNKIKSVDLIPKELTPKIYLNIKDLKEHSNETKYFIKPIVGSRGENIKILTKKQIIKDKLDLNKILIQDYITPSLINNKKYDIRMYYFVSKKDNNLSTFIGLNGKIRLCSKDYNKGGEITNSSLLNNKTNSIEELQGSLLNLLPNEQENIFKAIQEFNQHFIKNLETVSNNFVNLYGIDLIKDSNDKIWILEINGNPNWQVKQDSDVLRQIKTNLFNEILKILSNQYYSTNYYLENWKQLI